MSYAIHLTADDYRQLNAARLRRRYKERRARRAVIIREKHFARLGTDSPVLLLRELAHEMAVGRCEASGDAAAFVSWCEKRNLPGDAAECQAQAEKDLAQARSWALRFITLGKAARRRTLTKLAERNIHQLEAFSDAHIPRNEAPRGEWSAPLASHLSAQAPPRGHDLTHYAAGLCLLSTQHERR